MSTLENLKQTQEQIVQRLSEIEKGKQIDAPVTIQPDQPSGTQATGSQNPVISKNQENPTNCHTPANTGNKTSSEVITKD